MNYFLTVFSCLLFGQRVLSDVPGFVHVPVSGQKKPRSLEVMHPIAPINRFERRGLVHNAPLKNHFFSYSTEVCIGSPNAQCITAGVDTGSSDFWVMSRRNPKCQQNGGQTNCDASMMFDPSTSSSFRDLQRPFEIHYGDGTYAKGHYFQDHLKIADISLPSATMALAEDSDSDIVILGIGPRSLEAMANTISHGESLPTYDNIPVSIAKQGLSTKNAYSLYLDSPTTAGGHIIFGGVDRAKYVGELALLPMVNIASESNKPYSLHVPLNSVSVANWGDSQKCEVVEGNYPVLFDSGTSFNYLPKPIADEIANSLGYRWDAKSGYYIGSCKPRNVPDLLVFNFNGVDISIPTENFYMTLNSANADVCASLVLPSPQDKPYNSILGDVFMRWAYLTFDLDNYQVGIAPAIHGSSKSNVQAIDSSIPGALKAPKYNSNWSTKLNVFGYKSCRRVSFETSLVDPVPQPETSWHQHPFSTSSESDTYSLASDWWTKYYQAGAATLTAGLTGGDHETSAALEDSSKSTTVLYTAPTTLTVTVYDDHGSLLTDWPSTSEVSKTCR